MYLKPEAGVSIQSRAYPYERRGSMGNSDVAGSLPRTGERLDRSSGAEIDLATILVWLRRCIGLIALLAVIGAGAGLAFGTVWVACYCVVYIAVALLVARSQARSRAAGGALTPNTSLERARDR